MTLLEAAKAVLALHRRIFDGLNNAKVPGVEFQEWRDLRAAIEAEEARGQWVQAGPTIEGPPEAFGLPPAQDIGLRPPIPEHVTVTEVNRAERSITVEREGRARSRGGGGMKLENTSSSELKDAMFAYLSSGKVTTEELREASLAVVSMLIIAPQHVARLATAVGIEIEGTSASRATERESGSEKENG